MVEVKLTEDCMRLISQFESLTGAGSRDCVIDERNGRLIFVVNPGDMGLAIGKKGASIKKASEVMGKKIEVVEYNSNPEQFLKNCFLPAQVTSIVFTGETGAQSATVEVRDEDRGIAIGKDGKNIFKAKKLALRQHNIVDVQILQKPADKRRIRCHAVTILSFFVVSRFSVISPPVAIGFGQLRIVSLHLLRGKRERRAWGDLNPRHPG